MSEFSQWAFSFWWNHSGLVWKTKLLRYGVTLCVGKKKKSLMVKCWLVAWSSGCSGISKETKISPKVMLKQHMDMEVRLRCFESGGYPCELELCPKLSQTNVVWINPGRWHLPAHFWRSYPTSAAVECAKFHPLSREVCICALVHYVISKLF